MKKLFILIFIYNYLFANVQIKLSNKYVKNGTSFAVIFKNDQPMKYAPNAIFKNKTYQMFINGNKKNYIVYMPVSYYNKLGKEKINIIYKIKDKVIKKTLYINVIDGNYKKNEIIKVKKSKVTLSKSNKKLTSNEYNIVFRKVYSKVTPKSYIYKSLFTLPIKSKITSDFGTARIYNNRVKSYHTGVDFRAKNAKKIRASNNAKVALVMKRFYLGNVVYLDHGRGAYSYYSHLSKALVKEGDIVKKGDIIGLSGNTGRVTAEHLHYAFRLYNVTVDPLQFSSLHNKLTK